ncbi:MAG TPA: transglutaminase-like domain-containing protein, partial [Abditibacteriaceae bacterium]|nr:transglutaminase-like domain-containing protein [Abditibacteriaceae bacterium]
MSSYLIYNENGHITEDSFTPCAKPIVSHFCAPLPAQQAEVFLVARKMVSDAMPLRFFIGDREYCTDGPVAAPGVWLRCPVDAGALIIGDNVLTVPAQQDWEVAVEAASAQPVIRLRVADGASANEEIMPEYGDPAIAKTREAWLAMLPESLRTIGNRWEWCWELAGFVSTAWVYSNTLDANSYAPWDARTILQWGRAARDDRGEKPIVMCVHYGVCFVQLCTAMGVPARVVVLTPGLNSYNGHFVAEVWLEEYGTWAMVDANMHMCYKDRATQRPLAVAELASLGNELQSLAQFGRGWEAQRARFQPYVDADYLTGTVYRLWGVWRRHNWIERPDLAPPAHGAVVYCET